MSSLGSLLAKVLEVTDRYMGVRFEPMSTGSETRIPCSKTTRERYIKPLKRGGESYDELLRKMAEQYDPEESRQ